MNTSVPKVCISSCCPMPSSIIDSEPVLLRRPKKGAEKEAD